MDNHELITKLEEEDQEDRALINPDNLENFDWNWLRERDLKRLEQIRGLYRNGKIKTADDLFNAGVILLHGKEENDYKIAIELAEKLLELARERGKWLYPRAVDRLHLFRGGAQVWGTNFEKKEDGKWYLAEPFDKEAKTDKERREMGIDIEAKLRQKNKE